MSGHRSREANPGRWIGNPRFTQWAIEDPDAEITVKSLFYFLPVKTEFHKMQTCLETAKNSNTRGRSKSTEELKKVVIQTKALNPKR